MKKVTLILGASLLLASCGGGLTWETYQKSCVMGNSIFDTEEVATKKCDCEIEKYKAAGLEANDMSDMEKTNAVDVTGCKE